MISEPVEMIKTDDEFAMLTTTAAAHFKLELAVAL